MSPRTIQKWTRVYRFQAVLPKSADDGAFVHEGIEEADAWIAQHEKERKARLKAQIRNGNETTNTQQTGTTNTQQPGTIDEPGDQDDEPTEGWTDDEADDQDNEPTENWTGTNDEPEEVFGESFELLAGRNVIDAIETIDQAIGDPASIDLDTEIELRLMADRLNEFLKARE